MHQKLFAVLARAQRSGWTWLTATICALLLVLLPGNLLVYAASQPGGDVSNPVVRAVDMAKPAVVRIIAVLDSHLTVRFSSGDVTFPQDREKSYSVTLSGSGTFISANGDILTADHVVNPPKDASLDDTVYQYAANDVAQYINQDPKKVGLSQMSGEQVKQALESGQLKSSAAYDQPKSEAFLSTDYTGPLSATTLDQVPQDMHAPIDKVEAESSSSERDVAIVHAGFTDTPSIKLGDSSTVQSQDTLNIIGFPGNGDINDIPTNLFTSSVNTITVSSIKTSASGAPLIQVGGNVEHGDSGGPALDATGNVVGIVSFTRVTPNSPGGTSFLQASSSANDLLKGLKVDLAAGKFQKLWNDAFTSYAATTPGHWQQAQQKFEQISTQYPNFKAVQKYLDYSKAQAKSEQGVQLTTTATSTKGSTPATTGATTNKMSALALTVGAVVLLLALVGLFSFMLIRTRKKRGTKAASGKAAPPPATSANPGASTPDPLAAFGAPPRAQGPNTPPASLPGATPIPQMQTLPSGAPTTGPNTGTFTLRPWPCGHMNRSNARFCSVCGEPAPVPPRRIEQ